MKDREPTTQSRRLGELVRKARTSKGFTVRALADGVGINFSTLSYLEQGLVKRPATKTLQKLSRSLDLPLGELYTLAGYSKKEGLPELRAYLRSKYGLSANDAAELQGHFDRLRKRGKKQKGGADE